MFRYLHATAWGLAYPARLARRRPWAAVAAALVVAAAAVASGWAYARHQWQTARDALAADRPQEARARLALPLLLWGRDPSVHLLAARAARMSGDLPGAEAHLKQSTRLAGGATAEVQLEYLLLRVQTGEVDQVAPTLLEVADNGHPEGPLILSTLAVAYMHELRYRPAIACLSRWIELEPDAAKAYQYRGWVLERMARRKEAVADYRKALEIDPNPVGVRLALAQVLLEENQLPEALPHLERLYAEVPNDPLVQARLGTARYQQGRMEEARQLMEAAAERLPNDPALQIQLARLDLNEGRADAAERRLRAVLQRDPSDIEASYTLYLAVQAQGRADEASAIWEGCKRARAVLDRTQKLLRDVVDSPSGRAADCAELGRLFLEIKQENRGLYWLYEALQRDPDQQEAHRALAAYYERQGNADKAALHRRHVHEPAAPSGRPAGASPAGLNRPPAGGAAPSPPAPAGPSGRD
jgi:predicted Zn-dependent protease